MKIRILVKIWNLSKSTGTIRKILLKPTPHQMVCGNFPSVTKRIPDSSEQKYLLENQFIFSEIPLKHKKVFPLEICGFPTSLLLCFRAYNISMYNFKGFKDSSWESWKEGLWNQFSFMFFMNFGQRPVKGESTMWIEHHASSNSETGKMFGSMVPSSLKTSLTYFVVINSVQFWRFWIKGSQGTEAVLYPNC